MSPKYTTQQVDAMTHQEIANALVASWSTNDMDTFLSLFAANGTIEHPLFPQSVSPSLVADVLRVDKMGESTITHFSKTGSDEYLINVDEAGSQRGGAEAMIGNLPMKLTFEGKRIKLLKVGYFTVRAKHEPARIIMI